MGGALGSVEDREWKQLGREAAFDPVVDLVEYLRGPFRLGVGFRVTTSRAAGCGLSLSERMVSRLEVLTALRMLPVERWRRIMEGLYCDGRRPREVMEAEGISRDTLYRLRNEALKHMVRVIYDEWGGEADKSD